MALTPEARAAVEAALAETQVHDPSYDVAAARVTARETAAREPREDVAEVRDLDAGGVPVRLYRPADAAPGLVVHLHGGGFVFNDVEVHDAVCRRFANRLGRAVLSVDYRLAPEHPFPAARDDVDTVLAWLDGQDLAGGGSTYGHGDSAGANLALVAALRHPGRFAAVVAIYPFLDPTGQFPSYDAGAEAGFDRREAEWYWDQYAAPEHRSDPDVAPLLSDRLGSLPPLLVTTAEHDPLRDEGERLADLVAQAGGRVTATRWLGLPHGYWRHPSVFPQAPDLMDQAVAFLRAH